MSTALTRSLLARRQRALEAAQASAPAAQPARSEVDRAIRAAAGRSPAPAPPAEPPARALDGGAREHSAPPRPADPNAQMNRMIRAAAAQVGGGDTWTVGG